MRSGPECCARTDRDPQEVEKERKAMQEEKFAFNGINGATGEYLLSGLSTNELSKIARGETLEADHLTELKHRAATREVVHLGVREGIDPTRLAESGWGVIFAHADGKDVEKRKEAMKPLLDLRREQAGKFYKEYVGQDAYRPGESKKKFLARHKVGFGPANPKKVPYYLLIVADPEVIPYTFQYQLAVTYAVGRIHFDNVEDYTKYAQSVVDAEKGQSKRERVLSFFGVQNEQDTATNLSAKQLVGPLATELARIYQEWDIVARIKNQAHKADLLQILGQEAPAFLFTASHGMGFPKNHPLQFSHQGALLCQDWPGPVQWHGQIPPEQYFSADDLDRVNVRGLVAFCFACYGAGTPTLDQFAHKAFKERTEIASKSFLAKLPQQMLCHPGGSALAVVGHVERAWGYSFLWPGAGTQLDVFEDTIKRLLEGHPLGSAMEYFHDRYAALSAALSTELEEIKFGKQPDDMELAGLWTANNDARSYVIIGDPAVRLNV